MDLLPSGKWQPKNLRQAPELVLVYISRPLYATVFLCFFAALLEVEERTVAQPFENDFESNLASRWPPGPSAGQANQRLLEAT